MNKNSMDHDAICVEQHPHVDNQHHKSLAQNQSDSSRAANIPYIMTKIPMNITHLYIFFFFLRS